MCDSLQIEEENAALLAALTDSLDGMVDAEVGGLSVFPALVEEPDQEEEEEESLPLTAEDFSQPLGAETKDPSLVRNTIQTSFLLHCCMLITPVTHLLLPEGPRPRYCGPCLATLSQKPL